MLGGTDSSRGMIYILLTGVITILSANLSSAITCAKSFRTLDGGYSAIPRGRASCDTGLYTHDCSLDSCHVPIKYDNFPMSRLTFTRCKKADGSGTFQTIHVASFVSSVPPRRYIADAIDVPGGKKLTRYYCPVSQPDLPECLGC
ncbi:hypothetical protein Pst134EA_000676 [Puccinia striiformis f. sp. tritici]|nr:hypothetical protein Pst134EA_000676 [Puccinia striiformis f. sp. tritici]KAH9466824.1 hypothetical protein Pst134EB_001873 [Puccinia striiformis f. sp. tritici]KAH9473596.1 hypothetical protein Pst134EA_000676 [Puccinia striiformis f. sp. tritici]